MALLGLLAVILVAAPSSAVARPAGAGKDGRPNILVVMTDDMNQADLAFMPKTRKLLAEHGTSFTNAITSFPLCCPSRATFLTGQYAHNHGVGGNFYPEGWYGMAGRDNTLATWLDRGGYRTDLIGKMLNGYGALDAHGEIPPGFRQVARPARCLGLRLLQLRDEQQRAAAHLGGRRLRPQAGRLREHRGHPAGCQERRGRAGEADCGDGTCALQLLGRHQPRSVLA